jgi:hypothetical protein
MNAEKTANEVSKYFEINKESFVAGFEFSRDEYPVHNCDRMEELTKRANRIRKTEGNKSANSYLKGAELEFYNRK